MGVVLKDGDERIVLKRVSDLLVGIDRTGRTIIDDYSVHRVRLVSLPKVTIDRLTNCMEKAVESHQAMSRETAALGALGLASADATSAFLNLYVCLETIVNRKHEEFTESLSQSPPEAPVEGTATPATETTATEADRVETLIATAHNLRQRFILASYFNANITRDDMDTLIALKKARDGLAHPRANPEQITIHHVEETLSLIHI